MSESLTRKATFGPLFLCRLVSLKNFFKKIHFLTIFDISQKWACNTLKIKAKKSSFFLHFFCIFARQALYIKA